MDGGDCEISKVPQSFMHPETKHYTSVRFRYDVTSDARGELEAFLEERIRDSNCMITDFRDYDVISDLGGDRFLEEPRTLERRRERADLVATNFYTIAKLILHALSGPDSAGRFHLPHSFAATTPFQDLHHIFCNMSDVPLYVTAQQNPRWPWQAVQNTRRRVFF